MSPWQWALGAGALLAVAFIWSASRSRHPFDIKDAFMDAATGKASLNALLVAGFGLLSAWVIVDMQTGGADVTSVLTMVLGIFVGGRVVAQGLSTFKPTPDAGSQTKETVTRETVAITNVLTPPADETPQTKTQRGKR